MIIERTPGSPPEAGAAVTIGAYDGVHLGHRKVLTLLRELADARGLEAALVTFDRHPATVVRPESAPKTLTTLDQKLELLDSFGLLDRVAVLEFDQERRKESAEDFVREVLVDRLRARVVVVGEDFHFGRDRGGNVALLGRMGTDLGFEVVGLNLIAPDDDPEHEPYSSTRIRQLVLAGDVAGAARLLGRPHSVRGTVVAGDGRGRELGYPTANVEVASDLCLPAEGIYAGTLAAGTLAAERVERPAAISFGRRPTFEPHTALPLLEAYVLDFDGDLYGADVEVSFVERLRGDIRFDTVDALLAQMERDVTATRELLA